MSTIPSSQIVSVTPSVLAAGGGGIQFSTIVLTQNARVPIGTVASFPTQLAVANYFGPASSQAAEATVYFDGFENATQTPSAMLWTQYNTASVSAWLRGGNISAVPLATLQGYSGTLSVTIDGSLKTASINLSSATSFSNAAELIAEGLGISGVQTASFTGAIGGQFGTCTTSGTTLTLGSVTSGSLWPGDTVTANDGSNTLNTTIVSQLSGTAGGSAGATFRLTAAASPGNLTSSTITAVSLTVNTSSVTGMIAAGNLVVGSGLTAGEFYIGSQTGGTTGGAGQYLMVGGAQLRVASESMTTQVAPIQYDSVSGAFQIFSGTVGAASTITFGSGALATDLLLTQALGAITSQGAIAQVPATFMTNLIQVNGNWVCYMTDFDPDNGSGNMVKQALAAWKNTVPNRYVYIPWDTDITPTQSVPATSSLGYILANNGDSGSSINYEPSNQHLAAFVGGSVASINFAQPNGRATLAFKSQAGLVPGVIDPTTADNLAGNPQSVGNFGNGYNFYGAYGTAGQNNTWYQRGTVTGPFLWLDSYVNQIYFLNQMQIALLTTFGNLLSIPFNTAGNTIIEQVLQPTITQGLSFGAWSPGPIDAAQAVQINQRAGASIANAISTQGWYVQIIAASSSVRASRGPVQIIFWYLDLGVVQSMNLTSVAIQG